MSERFIVKINSKCEPLTALPGFGAEIPGRIKLGLNQRYFTVNDLPHIPVMGEIHFSRWPAVQWMEALQRMQAGGIEIVATYIFWIHHEEEKGVWDFDGVRNLRGFIDACHRLNFPLILRIGPWCHGECRNGGFPDWLVHDKKIIVRTNDPGYLELAKTLYSQIYKQAEGYLWKDGGPILGIQLENEHGHCGGPTGPEGIEHIRTLKEIAVDAGFDVPFYTATGWGGANVVDGETLPVLGGYCDAPWAQHTHQMPASDNYIFIKSPVNDTTIGADHGASEKDEFTYDLNAYPYATAELGTGLQVTAHRRTVPSTADIEAMMLCKLGSGANLLGYYMYHGGTNPEGKLSTLNESKETGYPNDVPIKSYDFQAAIRESGELGDNYRALKRLHLFLHDFGHLLAPGDCNFIKQHVSNPEDTEHLRICVRHNQINTSGFVFINNHQRHRSMKSHKNISIEVDVEGSLKVFNNISIPDHFYCIYPYNMRIGDSLLNTATAQPLCRLGDRVFFFTDESPEYKWEGEPADVITLSSFEALNTWKIGDKIFITDGDVRQHQGRIMIRSRENECFIRIYEETGDPVDKTINFNTAKPVDVVVKTINETDDYISYGLMFDKLPEDDIHEALLQIDYIGDKAEIYRDGVLIADWFTTGLPWRMALKRHDYATSYTVKIYPTVKDVYYDISVPEGCKLNSASISYMYEKELEM